MHSWPPWHASVIGQAYQIPGRLDPLSPSAPGDNRATDVRLVGTDPRPSAHPRRSGNFIPAPETAALARSRHRTTPQPAPLLEEEPGAAPHEVDDHPRGGDGAGGGAGQRTQEDPGEEEGETEAD